jgi:hypothetical protein
VWSCQEREPRKVEEKIHLHLGSGFTSETSVSE